MRKTRRPPPEPTTPEWRRFVEQKRTEAIALAMLPILHHDGIPFPGLRPSDKTSRGATPRPGSMTEYIREKGLLPAAEVDALIAATPSHHFSAADFERLGITGWQQWIARVIESAK